MFELAEVLDSLGCYREADAVEKTIIANHFMLTKKKIDPQKQLNNKLNELQSGITNLQQSMDDDQTGDEGSTNIKVTPEKVQDVETVNLQVK